MTVTATDKPRQTGAPPPAQAPEPAAAPHEPPKGAPEPKSTPAPMSAKPLPSVLAAKLTGAKAHTYPSGVTALEIPGVKPTNRGPDPAVPTNGPARAGAAAATGIPTAVAAADAGTAAALEDIAKAQRTRETEQLIDKNIAAKVVVLSGHREKGIAQLAAVMTDDRANFLKAHPEAAARLDKLVADLKLKLNGRMPEDAVVKLATLSMAREVYEMNGIRSDSPNDQLVALPGLKYRMAVADRVAERIIKDGNMPPDVALWMKEVAAKMHKRGLALIQNCVSTSIQTEAVSNMVARGELPANLSERDYRRTVKGMKVEAWREMGHAGAYSPDVVRQETERVHREKVPAVAYDWYRAMANESMRNTLSHTGGDQVTFYDPTTERVFSPTPEQIRVAAASYHDSSASRDLPTGAVVDGGTPGSAAGVFGEQERDSNRLDKLGDPIARSLAHLKAEDDAIRTEAMRRYLGLKQLQYNIATRDLANKGVYRPMTVT